MPKNEDKKLEALAKKNAAKIFKPKTGFSPKYDSTLPEEREQDKDRERFFKEMKKREF
jgi:hypothetical protein